MRLEFNHIRLDVYLSNLAHYNLTQAYVSRTISWSLRNMSTFQILHGSIEFREADSWIDILIEDIREKITEHNFNLNERIDIFEQMRQELENEPAPEPLRQEYYDEAYIDAVQRYQAIRRAHEF